MHILVVYLGIEQEVTIGFECSTNVRDKYIYSIDEPVDFMKELFVSIIYIWWIRMR